MYVLHNFLSPTSGDVKTTLLLNLNPNPKDDVDIHTATIFESRQESSIFYQRQVDDVIVVNSNLKQGSNGASHSGSDNITMGYEKYFLDTTFVAIIDLHFSLDFHDLF